MEHLHGGKLKYLNWAKSIVEEIDNRLKTEKSELELIRLSGFANGIEDTLLLSHQDAIDLLKSTTEEIEELKYDQELFGSTILELKGYYSGIEEVLNKNREMFRVKIPAFLLVFSNQEDLLLELKNILHNKFELVDYENNPSNYITGSTVFFTSSEDKAIEVLNSIDKEKTDVLFSCIYYKTETEINTFELNEKLLDMIYINTIILNEEQANLKRLSRVLYEEVRLSK